METRGHGDTETRGDGDIGMREKNASPHLNVSASPHLPIPPSPRLAWLANPWLHIALIVLVAAFFRLWLIDRIPPGLFGDEATDGLDALDVLAGRGAVFFPANYGREGLHMWIVAGMFRLLGVTPLALRLPSAIAGILTAVATYWLGREMWASMGVWEWRSRKSASTPALPHAHTLTLPYFDTIVPLVAALYLATSYWHIHFSRFGIRGVFTPLFGTLAFAAFWRAVNQRISESADQRINESANQRISESANQRISGSANQRISGSANQRISGSANQRINESANQRISESTNQRINESTNLTGYHSPFAIRHSPFAYSPGSRSAVSSWVSPRTFTLPAAFSHSSLAAFWSCRRSSPTRCGVVMRRS